MDNAMGISGLAAVMALSLAIALGMEWLCLRGVFLLLPSGNKGTTRGGARPPISR